ncbi:MAG: hypothetical protein KF862_12640 [Chitinophagaceae bacterium]|nr:hypothetical protein [Chitinophagaceae bacterium]
MTKILLAGTIAVLCSVTVTGMAQNTTALNTEKKELNQEKKELNKEKKAIKKQERTIRESEVSYQAKQQFAGDFPGAANVSYIRNGNMDEVWFTQNGIQYKAFYDPDARLIGTTTQKSMSDLPAVAQQEIQKKYSGYKIDKVILFDDNENNDSDMMLYGQQFADADNYFVELHNDGKQIVLQVNMSGEVFYFSGK